VQLCTSYKESPLGRQLYCGGKEKQEKKLQAKGLLLSGLS